MPALTTPTAAELNKFYPISESIPDKKREELANYVQNHMFVRMFGYEAATKISDGTIPDSASAEFLGFQKFLALCCSYREIKDPLVSTNFGAKIIDRQGSINPTNNQKSITLIEIENTISIHYKEAYSIVVRSKCSGVPSWGGYFSYKVSKL
jgi:hypothetical protein